MPTTRKIWNRGCKTCCSRQPQWRNWTRFPRDQEMSGIIAHNYLRVTQKSMHQSEWLVNEGIHNGAHFPLCAFTKNSSARSKQRGIERAGDRVRDISAPRKELCPKERERIVPPTPKGKVWFSFSPLWFGCVEKMSDLIR